MPSRHARKTRHPERSRTAHRASCDGPADACETELFPGRPRSRFWTGESTNLHLPVLPPLIISHRLQARWPQLQPPRLIDAPAAYKETGATAVIPPPNPAGGAWQPATPSDGLLRGKWWEIYQDPQLNQLEERIAANNPTLRQALETYLAAHDQVTLPAPRSIPRSPPGLPSPRPSFAERALLQPSKSTTYNDFALAGQASWEPDLWGRIRRTVEAARSNAQASAADMANVDLSLHAELAADYFQLRGLDAQTKLLTATVADLEGQLDLTQRRLAGGVGTEVDVAQARTQLETVRAQLVDIGVARAQYEHAIGTLADYNLSAFSIPPSPLDLAAAQGSPRRAVAAAGAPSRHRRRRAPRRRRQRSDRHRRQRLLSHHHARRHRRL